MFEDNFSSLVEKEGFMFVHMLKCFWKKWQSIMKLQFLLQLFRKWEEL